MLVGIFIFVVIFVGIAIYISVKTSTPERRPIVSKNTSFQRVFIEDINIVNILCNISLLLM